MWTQQNLICGEEAFLLCVHEGLRDFDPDWIMFGVGWVVYGLSIWFQLNLNCKYTSFNFHKIVSCYWTWCLKLERHQHSCVLIIEDICITEMLARLQVMIMFHDAARVHPCTLISLSYQFLNYIWKINFHNLAFDMQMQITYLLKLIFDINTFISSTDIPCDQDIIIKSLKVVSSAAWTHMHGMWLRAHFNEVYSNNFNSGKFRSKVKVICNWFPTLWWALLWVTWVFMLHACIQSSYLCLNHRNRRK